MTHPLRRWCERSPAWSSVDIEDSAVLVGEAAAGEQLGEAGGVTGVDPFALETGHVADLLVGAAHVVRGHVVQGGTAR
jgi:hypothetical protein